MEITPASGVRLSSNMPQTEKTWGAAGVGVMASPDDHQHPRITSSTRVTLTGDGTATVVYTRSFTAKPAIVLTAINPTGRQVQLEVTSDITTGADYTGCTIKGSRVQLLPSLSGVIIVGPIVSSLGNFDVLGASAAGVEVSVVAIMPSN